MCIWGFGCCILLQDFLEILSRGHATDGAVLPLLFMAEGRPYSAKRWRFLNLMCGGPFMGFSPAFITFSSTSGAFPVALRWPAVNP